MTFSDKRRRKDLNAPQKVSNEDSEGEAGDAGVYAQWAGVTVDNTKPLPKFENSVFDLKYQKDKRESMVKWKSKDKKDYASAENEKELGKERKLNRSKKRNTSKEMEVKISEPENKH